jgi:hypothetical protein
MEQYSDKIQLFNEITNTTMSYLRSFEDLNRRKKMFDDPILHLKAIYSDMLWIQDCAERLKRDLQNSRR